MQMITDTVNCASLIENLLNAACDLPKALAAAGASDAEVRKAAIPAMRIMLATARGEGHALIEVNDMLNDGMTVGECTEIYGEDVTAAAVDLRAAGLLQSTETIRSLS